MVPEPYPSIGHRVPVPWPGPHHQRRDLAILTLVRRTSALSQRITGNPDAVKRSEYSAAIRARDDGLRRVRKITWRVGLLSAAAAAVIGAKFAHVTAPIPHLSIGTSPSSTGSPSGGTSTSSGTSSGISSSSGVSSSSGASGGGTTTSG